MNTNYLENYINRFPNLLLSHTLKLADITDSKAIKLDDNQMLNSKEALAFPNKFELEVVRFWRKKKLLPFFEEGKHAKISISQLMWLRFLENLRNLSPSTAVLEAAHEYFLKRAYDQNLALKNYISLQDSLQKELALNPSNQVAKMKLDQVVNILKDPYLMFSVKIDMNYFNMYIMDEVINSTEKKTQFTYRMGKKILDEKGTVEDIPVFEIIKDGKVINGPDDENELNGIDFDIENSPVSIFSASYFLRDVFYDCNLSDDAFNIQILETSERGIFKLIKDKKIEIVSFSNGEKMNKEDYSLNIINNEYNINIIKEIKYKMCTRNYDYGYAISNTGEKINFNPNPNSEENTLKKK
jgi:hypothetical protein